MKLFWSGGSPFARKVMIVAHETGLADRLDTVEGSGTPLAPNRETGAYNPLNKLPCLVTEDGPAIYDSSVICQYLLSLAPHQTMLANGQGRFQTLTLEALGDGICDAAILIRYELLQRTAEQQSEDWMASQFYKIDNALKHASERWMSHLAGPFDLGHAALGCALSYLDLRYPTKDWRSAHPQLETWHNTFVERVSAQKTKPQG